MGFMKVIFVILCLIISTSVPAYAGSILWSKAHASTRLEKDQQWLSEALLAEETYDEPLLMEAMAEEPEMEPEESTEISMKEPESTEPQETSTEGVEELSAGPPAEVIVEDISPTPDELYTASEEGLDEQLDEQLIDEGDQKTEDE